MTRFLHISDTHIGVEDGFNVQGVVTLPFAKKLVDHISTLPFTPDFVVHTGDVVHEMPGVGNERAYELVKGLMKRVNTPVYYVTGNHDTSAPIKKFLTMGKKEDLSSSLNSYRFDLNGIRFLTVDARGPDKIDPHGLVSPEQMSIVEKEVAEGILPLVVFIHYPAVALDSTWLDRDMLILNGDELHSLLVRAKERIRGVFFGHVHRPISVVRDGILYSSAGSPYVQFYSYPGQADVSFQKGDTVYYSIVTIETNNVLIKTQTV